MKCSYACHSPEHAIARRHFLGTLGAGTAALAGGFGAMASPAAAKQLASKQKRVVVLFLAGGSSQLETWDPKPKTTTGGPFRAIPTSVTGLHISELLPMTANQMHHLALVRGVNTKENDHGKGRYLMETGRRQTPGSSFPQLGAVAAKALAPKGGALPGHIKIQRGAGGGRSNDAAYLGPEYSAVVLGNGGAPKNSARAGSLTKDKDSQRNAFRRSINDRFAKRRRTAETDAYTNSYEQALQLMEKRSIFDISKEPEKVQQRYGKDQLGQQCLLARRLLENGITFVQVSHSNYDTHNENFNFHLEQMGEFDRSFSALVEDLAQSGMLDSTLIIVMSEFGRTPRINQYFGRDHWGTAWSVCLGGAGLQRGAVVGKTNKTGTAVVDRQVNHEHLFHTYLSAVGLDSKGEFDIGGRPILMAAPTGEPIKELLS